jgi:hypothetical protein
MDRIDRPKGKQMAGALIFMVWFPLTMYACYRMMNWMLDTWDS